MNGSPETLWCITANIVKERHFGEGGKDIRNGTRLFRGGAKVYIIGGYCGMCESVIVIGHHRKSIKLICVVMRVRFLENFTVKPIYHSTVITMAKKFRDEMHGGAHVVVGNKALAEGLAKALPLWIEEY